MAKYSITITSEEDLMESWLDSNVPNMSFSYNEIELSECIDNEDGTYEATYESMELTSSKTYTYIDTLKGETTFRLDPGEYGVRPNSKIMT